MASDLTRAFQDAIINNPASIREIASKLGVSANLLAEVLRGTAPEPSAELVERARTLAIAAIRAGSKFGAWSGRTSKGYS